MEEFKIYSITDEYISYLQEKYPNVYSNKINNRTHTRKYIGTVLKINEVYYYIPMSSPKESDYQIAGDEKVIKKSIIPIIRIVVKNSKGIKELKGTLRISHMIPVPISELVEYDIDKEEDEKYKELVRDEWVFIRRNKEKIVNYAKVMYNQKAEEMPIGYVEAALNYKELEILCKQFEQKRNRIMQKSSYELIYDVVKQIPIGKVATYGQVASLAGNKKWSRVVGYALHVNPDPEHIPCHRVVNRFGEVSKVFAFGGENRQIALLQNEGVEFIDQRVDLEKYQWNQVTMEMLESL